MIGPAELAIVAALIFMLYVARRRGGPQDPKARVRSPPAERGWSGVVVTLVSAVLVGIGTAVGVLWLQMPPMSGSITAGAAAGLAGALVAMSAAGLRR